MVLKCEAPAFEKFKPTVWGMKRRLVKNLNRRFWGVKCRLLKNWPQPSFEARGARFWKMEYPPVWRREVLVFENLTLQSFSFLSGHHLGSIFLVGNSKNFLEGFAPGPLLTSSLGSPESLSRRKSCREFPGSCIFLIGNPRKFPGGFAPGLHLYWARFARQNRYRGIEK